MNDSVIAVIPILQSTTFMMSDPRKFSFFGAILDAILVRVPTDNAIVNAYHKLTIYGVRPMTEKLRKVIDEGNKPKRRGKQKAKAAPSEVVKTPKKVKKQARKPRSPYSPAQEDLKLRTDSEIREDATVRHEEDETTANSEPTPTEPIPKVSCPLPTSVPLTYDFFVNFPTSSPIITIISISSIPPLPPMFSVGVSLPHISLPLSTSLFRDSTTTIATTVTSTPEVTVTKSISEEFSNVMLLKLISICNVLLRLMTLGEDKREPQAKQSTGEQEQAQKLKANDQKGNEASTSKKGKEKLVDDNEEEEEELSESEKLVRKKRDKEHDVLLKIRKELEAQEAEDKITKVMLASHK
ncbi:unnamed protein product [Lactuca saligna]|uniref:Uncharacterized protein n=1 Tax=Lactuca saligna TaxID=75948 RepID=A0AA35YSW0_LACSI|nr:unnamed protein product [Lactuca saligna]